MFFKFEGGETSDKVRFTLVTEDKKQDSGAAFQIMGTLEDSKIPKDLSSVSGQSHAGCVSTEGENSCAAAFTGQMLDDDKNMFLSKADSAAQDPSVQVDFKGKVKITHIRAMTTKDTVKKVASFDLIDSGKAS